MQSADPFPASEFDQWAESYDADVVTYDTFPFAGRLDRVEVRLVSRDTGAASDARAAMGRQ